MINLDLRKKESVEVPYADSIQTSLNILHDLAVGRSDNESDVIRIFHGIYASHREMVQPEHLHQHK